jgi:hypothetical protein
MVITIDHMEKVRGRSLQPVIPFQGFKIQRNEALDLGILGIAKRDTPFD